MTLKAISGKGSSPIGEIFSPSARPTALVIECEFNVARPIPLPNTRSLDAVLAEFSAIPDVADRFPDARRQLAGAWYGGPEDTLSSIRLREGLSQQELAGMAATSQSHIARIELGKNDPTTEVVSRIAAALGVGEELVFKAIRRQRHLTGSGQ